MTSLEIRQGADVTFRGRHYRITRPLDLNAVLALDAKTGERRELPIAELAPFEPDEEKAPQLPSAADLAAIPKKYWAKAERRYEIIKPLLGVSNRTEALVSARAQVAGVHMVTIYRWINRFESTGQLTALVSIKKSGGKGQSRLDPDVETVLVSTIEKEYLRGEKPSVDHTAREVIRRCRNAKLSPPHPNTVRNRIKLLIEKEKVRRREGKDAARRYEPIQGPFPVEEAAWPLAHIQIDHTKLDVMVVDDDHRLSIGRPWITLAIDGFSRMVAGFYVSLDPPSTMSVGLCLANAILPKEKWLAEQEIDTPWPVWGLMDNVQADNAKEFRGKMLAKACQNYGIGMHWRPCGKPQYGAYIERLLGTFSKEIHSLKGTTFSNTRQRGSYPSEKNAALTLAELEKWLTTYIVQVYHQRIHKSLGTSPLKRFEEGIFGTENMPGRGVPSRLTDESRLRIDLMPYELRSVQAYGIVMDHIHYYSDALRPWICANDPEESRRKRKFIVRRDPRDISQVYFYDPELNQHFAIPYRDIRHPAMSLWELREVKRKLEEEGQGSIDETLIFTGYNRMRAIEQEATEKSKHARRRAQRRRTTTKKKKAEVVDLPPPVERTEPEAGYQADWLEDLQPFDELEDLGHE